jgi:hypothetical protein
MIADDLQQQKTGCVSTRKKKAYNIVEHGVLVGGWRGCACACDVVEGELSCAANARWMAKPCVVCRKRHFKEREGPKRMFV